MVLMGKIVVTGKTRCYAIQFGQLPVDRSETHVQVGTESCEVRIEVTDRMAALRLLSLKEPEWHRRLPVLRRRSQDTDCR